MFHPQVALWDIAIRTALVYLVVLVGLRIAGKREIGQMTAFDLVVILLVANAVQNAMVGIDTSVPGGLLAALVLIALNYLVANLRERVPWFRRAVEGTPTLLIHDGEFIDANLRRERVDVDEVLMAIREHGIEGPADVRAAVLETDGSISIVPVADGNAVLHSKRHVRQRPHN